MSWQPDPDALRGRVAVVAGATRGAGRGIAAALGEAGATVVCTGRSSRTRSLRSDYDCADTIEETAELVTRLGGVGVPAVVDHLDSDQAGTTAATGDGGAVGGDDIAEQTREAIRRIAAALEQVGAGLAHVVRTRMFVTDIGRWAEAGRAHGEFFAGIRPASSMVEVRALIEPALLVEIEADAVVG